MILPSSIWTVEHDDGTVHAIDTTAMEPGVQPWRNTPVCGTATGPSSDEGGELSWEERPELDCTDCISILS